MDPKDTYFALITMLFLGGSLSTATEMQLWKYKYLQSDTDLLIADFKESASFLNKFDNDNTKTVIICGNGWNSPMVAWHKKAHRIAWKFKKQLPIMFNQNFDIIITQNRSFEENVIKNMPNFKEFVNKISDNGKVTVWEPK